MERFIHESHQFQFSLNRIFFPANEEVLIK